MTEHEQYRVIRSKRRTISLEITSDAKLIVRAPLHATNSGIHRLISEKQGWIDKKISEMKNRPNLGKRSFVVGEEFLFLGKKYVLDTLEESNDGISLMGDRLYIGENRIPECRDLLIEWYSRKAADIVPVRVAGLSSLLNYLPKKIRITDTKRRWASCSSTGTLSFCWRLIMAPPEVIDYVIVHELTHLYQMDHSNRFWEKVDKAMPGYEKHRLWLIENERMLTI